MTRCPYCKSIGKIYKKGFYFHRIKQRKIQRFYCKSCNKRSSEQTLRHDFRYRKKLTNQNVFRLLASGVSQRKIAEVLNIDRKTVDRRVIRYGLVCKENLNKIRLSIDKCLSVQFDEMETFEHTKCKPVTIPIAVEEKTRRILAISVGSIAAKGKLAKISLKKYGKRKCQRKEQLQRLMDQLKQCCNENTRFFSDKSPFYPLVLKSNFKDNRHEVTKGKRGCVVGLGELKKGGYDPLFALNHTYAMVRDNIKRLARKTWCTTKKVSNLEHILNLYAWVHNLRLQNCGKEIRLESLNLDH